MSDSKGKGKAKASDEVEDGTRAPAPPQSNNILERVAASASGLARSAFAAPNSNELNNVSNSAVAGAGKAQQPSSSGDNFAYAETPRPAQAGPSPQTQYGAPASFRSTHPEQHAEAAKAEFSSFLDSIPSFVPSAPTESFEETWHASNRPLSPEAERAYATSLEHTKKRFPQAVEASAYTGSLNWVDEFRSPAPAAQARTNRFKTVAEAEAHDGQDVLNILGDVGSKELDYYEPQRIEDEIEDWKLGPEQVGFMRRLATELLPARDARDGHKERDMTDPANLLPSQLNHEKAEWLPEEYAQDSYSHFGQVASPEEAQKLWVEQWEGVLSRYQDEVWGGLLPLVKQAKEEIKEIHDGTADSRPAALRRLDLVLGHFR